MSKRVRNEHEGPADVQRVFAVLTSEDFAACKAEREALQGSMGEESKDFQDKALKMSRCMREQGVDMPDPTMSEDGKAAVEINPDQINSPEFKKAEEICRKQVGFAGPGGGAGGGK